MNVLSTLLAELVALLEHCGFCENIRIVETAFFSGKQFSCKIRATVFSNLALQIRLYYNHPHWDYSYQVFDNDPLCRWDNKEHFPDLSTHPHHDHTREGEVIASPLVGDPREDLSLVLSELERLFKSK